MMRRKILFAIAMGVLPFLLWKGMAWRQEWLKQSLVAQLRQGTTQGNSAMEALRQLVVLDARDTLPVIKEEFARREKKTYFLEFGDLRLQLLRVLSTWLPDNEVVPFLIAVDDDAEEAPKVRFRAVILLCERGDAPALAHLDQRYFTESEKVEPLVTVESLEKSMRDRTRFGSDEEFAAFKVPAAEELAGLQKGIQLAQHLYEIQQLGPMGADWYVGTVKVQMRNGTNEIVQFCIGPAWVTWRLDLRKRGDRWLPYIFYMSAIE